MMYRLPFWLLPVLAVAACAQFPELEGTIEPDLEDAPYPELVRLEPILAAANTITVDPVQTEAHLNTRLAGLRARANAMRGAVLSDAEKKRLDEDLSER